MLIIIQGYNGACFFNHKHIVIAHCLRKKVVTVFKKKAKTKQITTGYLMKNEFHPIKSLTV